jgi:hypothetical protein
MNSRVILYPTSGAVLRSRGLRPTSLPSGEASILEFPVKNAQLAADLSDSDADGLGCARGVPTALAIESAVALALYGLWQFLRLVS